MFDCYVFECLLAFWGSHHPIQIEESFFQGTFIITALEGLTLLNNLGQVLGAVIGDLEASMSVENSEEEDLFADAMEDHCVFHVFTPA